MKRNKITRIKKQKRLKRKVMKWFFHTHINTRVPFSDVTSEEALYSSTVVL